MGKWGETHGNLLLSNTQKAGGPQEPLRFLSLTLISLSHNKASEEVTAITGVMCSDPADQTSNIRLFYVLLW